LGEEKKKVKQAEGRHNVKRERAYLGSGEYGDGVKNDGRDYSQTKKRSDALEQKV